jgi:hypothetical protein
LIAALRQRSRPIVIEDPDIALPFIRMLRARLPAVGIRRYHSAEIEATGMSVNMFFQETCTELS